MSSRRYVKRVWRVPKHRGATEYLATLVTKLMIKHGWPVKWEELRSVDGFAIVPHDGSREMPADMLEAAQIACRIIARTYRVDVDEQFGVVIFNRSYRVTDGGHFREIEE